MIARSLRDVSPLSWEEFVAQKSLQRLEPPRALTPRLQKKKEEIASTSRRTGQASSAPVAPGLAALIPESSARVQTRAASRRERGKTKVRESFGVEQIPKFDPPSQKRQRSSPVASSPATLSPTATPVAVTSSPSSSDKEKPSRQFKKRKATRAPLAATTLPRRVSTRTQCKVSPASPQPEVIVISEESVESKPDVSQNMFESAAQSSFVILEEK